MNVLIIEDEPPAQQEISRILTIVDSSICISGYCDSVKGSITWLSSNKPDLIFMDIQLADGYAFEIFPQVKLTAPVIFTTAYNEYAIQAFKVNSIDYLLKPLNETDVLQAIKKYYSRSSGNSNSLSGLTPAVVEQLIKSFNRPAYKTRFTVSVGDRIKYLEIADIAYFMAEGNIVFAICRDSGRHIVNYTLDQLETLLDPESHFRLNRSFISGIRSIKEVRKYFNSRLRVYLAPLPEKEVLISRIKVADFINWMG